MAVWRMMWLRQHWRNTAGPGRKQGCRGTTTTWNISLGLISCLHAAVSAHRQWSPWTVLSLCSALPGVETVIMWSLNTSDGVGREKKDREGEKTCCNFIHSSHGCQPELVFQFFSCRHLYSSLLTLIPLFSSIFACFIAELLPPARLNLFWLRTEWFNSL